MTLPNFLIIGAARSGTTALYEYLIQHPDVFMSEPKEPHFFSFHGETLRFQGPFDDVTINRNAVTDLDRYIRLFQKAGSAKAVGEASVSYLYYPRAIDRINKHIKNAKLICLLRNPADRAYSAFMYMRSLMREPLSDFRAALDQEEQRIEQNWQHIWHYRRMGYYYGQLKRYFDAFDPNLIRVYLFDHLKRDKTSVVKDCFRFLGVDDTFEPNPDRMPVVSGVPKNVILHKFLTRANILKSLIRPMMPRRVRRVMHRRLTFANLRKERIDPRIRSALIEDFREDILRLQDLIGLDLSMWLSDKDGDEAESQGALSPD